MKRTIRQPSGFTLIECLVAIAILGLAVAAVGQAVVAGQE